MKNGGYKVVGDSIYVFGVVDNQRYRLSTGKKANKINLNWIKKNHQSVLLNLIAKKNSVRVHSVKLEDFSIEILEATAHKRDKNSQKDYLSKLNRLILPHFKSFKLGDLKPLDIEKWQATLLKKYSGVTVKKTTGILNMILRKAVANDIIVKNPVEFADNIKIVHQKKEPYSIEEMKSILQNSEGWLKLFVHLAFTTGMRTGELMALKWEDIDLEQKILYLRRSITKGVVTEVQSSTSKKNHHRMIVIADFVIEILKSYKAEASCQWIFPSKTGMPYNESKAIVRYFKPLLEELGIEYKTLYATRHTYISIMRNHGVSADWIAEIVGHSKEVEDKHYYTESINMQKVAAVNNVFEQIKIGSRHS